MTITLHTRFGGRIKRIFAVEKDKNGVTEWVDCEVLYPSDADALPGLRPIPWRKWVAIEDLRADGGLNAIDETLAPYRKTGTGLDDASAP